MNNKNIVEVKNLSVSFQMGEEKLTALHGVSFSLEQEKILGIAGESGCGKSISAMSIIKLLPSNAVVDSGEIFFYGELNGQNLLDLSEKQMQKIRGKKISFIPQDPMTSLNPLFSVGEQIIETIIQHKQKGFSVKEAEKLAIEALRSVKIPEAEKRLNDFPHQFSGGMRQRVIIAMALCCEPELIIADEPTTALDATVQVQILDLIKQIQNERQLSLIFISHNLGVISQFCDNAAVMYSGRIVEYSTAQELFSSPLHPYTQALVEALPMPHKKVLQALSGQPPALGEDVCGCIFHPRCKHCMEICKIQMPKKTYINKNHFAACHLLG